tara:strand:+ start:1291 stop:1422 length:132 start_codon:yes stop_codon:yes gene_type:complete
MIQLIPLNELEKFKAFVNANSDKPIFDYYKEYIKQRGLYKFVE